MTMANQQLESKTWVNIHSLWLNFQTSPTSVSTHSMETLNNSKLFSMVMEPPLLHTQPSVDSWTSSSLLDLHIKKF